MKAYRIRKIDERWINDAQVQLSNKNEQRIEEINVLRPHTWRPRSPRRRSICHQGGAKDALVTRKWSRGYGGEELRAGIYNLEFTNVNHEFYKF